jgi:DNA-binding transcriptional regulator YbjK
VRPVSATRATRTGAILDAALRLIGERGPQAVTHRAVAHHFAGRGALVEEALRHLARREIAALERLALDLAGAGFDRDSGVRMVAAYLGERVAPGGPGTGDMLATYELLLECARNPGLRDIAAEWTAAQLRLCVLVLRAAGSPDPEEHGYLMLASLSGLLLKQLAYPREDFEQAVLAPALRTLIDALAP